MRRGICIETRPARRRVGTIVVVLTVLSALLLPVPSASARTGRRRNTTSASAPAQGFRAVAGDGGVFDFGTNRYLGSLPGLHVVPAAPIVGMAPTPTGLGYWLVGADGGIFCFGDARFDGSLGGLRLAAPIVGMAATPDGRGYWLAGADGGVFSFGDARFDGSLGGFRLASSIVGIASTPDGRGYWLAGADGGVFAFGDAGFHGSLPAEHLRSERPIVGISSAFTGAGSSGRVDGYWLVGSDGGVFGFDAPYFGSLPAKGVGADDVIGLTPSVDNKGYWVARSDGSVYAFGAAPFIGDFQTSTAARGDPTATLARPWIGLSTVAPPGAAPGPTAAAPAVSLAYGPGTGTAERDGATAISKVTVRLGGVPDAGAPVTVQVSGANPRTLRATTDPSGTAFLPYIGTATGADSLMATSGTGQSGALSIDWSAPASLYAGARLSLSPSNAGPDILNQTQTLTATLTSAQGRPLPDMFVPWSVAGANRTSGTAVTDASGHATISYSGALAGTDTVTASFQAGSITVDSNPATVTWQSPSTALADVSVGPVTGDFFAASPQSTAFSATPATKPAFSQSFPDIEFDPPAGTVPGDTDGVTPSTTPFTDVTTDGVGNADGRTVAQGNGLQAGTGTLAAFDAVLQGSFQVSRPGLHSFELFRSDGFILGVGAGATATGNVDVNPPANGVTAFAGLPVLAADNQVNSDLGPDPITVDFPAAGAYPFELDYLERSAANGSGQMTLALTDQSNTTGLDVSFGYADDTTTPASGTFPSPWSGSSGVSFVGGPGPYDGGAIQIKNTTATPVSLDGVTVDIGSQHFDPWSGQSLTVPASGSLVLAGTGSNLDTSETAQPRPSTLPPGTGFSFGTYASGIPNTYNIGPVGMAQASNGDFYFDDLQNGDLYRLPPAGGPVTASEVVANYGGQPIGLTFSSDYRHLYMALRSAGQLVEIDPSTGALLRTVADIPGVNGITADPSTGDLIADDLGSDVFVIADPQSATPTVTKYTYANQTFDGLAVGPDGTIYVDSNDDGFLMISGAGTSTPGALIKDVQSNQLSGTDGIALLPASAGQSTPTVVQNSNNGVIYTIADALSSSPAIGTIYTGGTRGDFVTVGADGCLYATQTDTVLKGTAADGSCPFIPFGCPAMTTVPQVHIVVKGEVSTYQDTGLALTSGGVDGDHCGGSNESVQWTAPGATPPSGPPVPPAGSLRLSPAALGDKTLGTAVTVDVQAMTSTGQPAPAGTPVTLDVTGPNAATLDATTDATGVATFTYTGRAPGLDSLVATTAATATVPAEVSNTLTVGWYSPVPATPAPTGTNSGLWPPSITGLSPGSGADLTAAAVPVSAVVTAAGSPVASWSAAVAPAGGGTATPIGSGNGEPPPTLGSIATTSMASGRYQLTVTATSVAGGTSSVAETVSIQVPAPPPPPAISSVAPADGATATTPVPVTASIAPPAGQSITSWAVTYQLGGGPAVPLASGSGTPPGTLASFDPTMLPDGTYVIAVSATSSGGGTQTATTSVAVTGGLKPGRYTATYQDVSVPVDGLQMSVDRTYDSLDKSTGDFGVGWHLSLGDFRVTTNGPLGAGGWSQYDPVCFFALCTTAYRSSKAHYVTVTWPDGHAEVFDFTPTGGSSLFPSVGPGFTAAPGTATTSTLSTTAPVAGMTAGGDLVDDAGNAYSPTEFTLTTTSGDVLTLSTVSGLVSEQDPNGNSLSIDSSGVHASNGQSLAFARDGAGRITSVTTPAGAVYTYTYSSAGDLSTVTPPSPAGPDSYTYDANHNLLSQSGPGAPAESLTYDATSRLVKVTDASGDVTTITNDVGNRQQVVTDPSGRLTTVYSYDPSGDVTELDQSAGGTTLTQKWTYDQLGDRTSYTDADGHVSTATYDGQGDQTSSTDADGRTTRYSFNSRGEMIALTKPDGTVGAVSVYDQAGNATQVETAEGTVNTLTYTAGELQTSTDPLGKTTTYSYDSQGRLAGVTEPDGLGEQITSDSDGRPTSVTNPDGQKTSLGYDAAGRLTSVTDGNGSTWTYSYDGLGDQTGTVDPLGRTATTTYNAAQQIVSGTNTDGQTVSYSYDPDGNLIRETRPTQTDTYGFDPFGRLVSASDPAASDTISYDPAGLMAAQTESITGAPPVTFKFAYDPAGKLDQLEGPGGTSSYSYDVDGQLASVTGPGYTFGYSPAGRLTSELQDNLAQTYTYDGAGQLTGISDTGPSGTLASYGYGYDPEGRRVSATTPAGTTTYGYDGSGQLTNVAYPAGGPPSGSYTYDPAGNRLSSPTQPAGALVYDKAEELTAAGPVSYTYDGEGNLVTATDTTTGAKTAYTWNAVGQLSGIQLPNGQTESFSYDPFGRRVSATSGSQTDAYLYLGLQPSAVYSGAGSPSQLYTNVPGQNAPIAVTQGGSTDTILRDALGSTVGMADATGQMTSSYSYDAFGSPVGSAPVGPGFTGQTYDPASGLYYDNTRFYDPSTGRFLSPDPLQASNPYPYVANDPVNAVDPTGAEFITTGLRDESTLAEAQKADQLSGCVVGILTGAAGALGALVGPPNSLQTNILNAAVGGLASCLGATFFGSKSLITTIILDGALGLAGGAITGAVAAWAACAGKPNVDMGKALLIGTLEGALSGEVSGALGGLFGGPMDSGLWNDVPRPLQVAALTQIGAAPSFAAGAATAYASGRHLLPQPC